MEDRVCIVTGANSGIGKATAEGLARRGAMVVMACRDPARGQAALEAVRAASGSQDVHLMPLDLASLASVRGFAEGFAGRFGRLDVLVNNAGIAARERRLTADGFELQFGVNHLGHFLLTRLLLPLFLESPDPRVVVVASTLHRAGRIAWDDLRGDRDYRMLRAYAQSKLANLLFVHELAKRAEGIAVNGLHPGSVATAILREMPLMVRLPLRPFSTSAEKGARTSIHLAAAPELAGVTGRYFEKCREQAPAPAARDDAAARRLWELSEALTG